MRRLAVGKPSPLPRPCPETTSPSRTNRRPRAVRGHARSPAASASRIDDDDTVLPSTSTSATPSAVSPNGAPSAGRFSTVPAALWPNVKFAPMTACKALTPPTRTRSTKPSAGIWENSFVNARTTRSSMPMASMREARRSTVVSSRGSLPGVRTSRGCRSNVIATARTPRSRAASTVRAITARWPRWTPSKNPTVTTDGPPSNGEPFEPFDDPHRTSVSRTGRSGLARRSHARTPQATTVARMRRVRARVATAVLLCLPLALIGCGRDSGPPGHERPRRRHDHDRFVQLPRERGAGRDLRAGPRGPRIPRGSPARRRSPRAPDPRAATGSGGAGARVRGKPAGLLRGDGLERLRDDPSTAGRRARSARSHGLERRSRRGPQRVRHLGDDRGAPERGVVERPDLVRARA